MAQYRRHHGDVADERNEHHGRWFTGRSARKLEYAAVIGKQASGELAPAYVTPENMYSQAIYLLEQPD